MMMMVQPVKVRSDDVDDDLASEGKIKNYDDDSAREANIR